MALGSALVDRARVRRNVVGAVRVEGGYQTTEVVGPWFRCMYDEGNESEQRSDGGVRRRRTGASMLVGRRNTDGTAVDIQHQDRVEIDSRRYGQITLYVEGTPKVIAKRRTRIGIQVALAKTQRASS